MPNEYASLLICYSILYLLFTGLQQYLSIVLLISNVIAIKIDLTTNSTITQHIMIVYRFICWYFNPHSHEGSDIAEVDTTKVSKISIHAPTRGATLLQIGSYIIISISIHAPTRGATVSVLSAVAFSVFQSTLPREERPFLNFNNPVVMNFNPRSHERSDKNK